MDRYKQLNEGIINIIKKHVNPQAYLLIASTKQDFIKFSDSDIVKKDFKNDLQQLIKNSNDSSNKIHDDYVGLNVTQTDNPIINALTSCPYWSFFDSKLESDRLKQRAIHIKSELLNLIRSNYMFIKFFHKIKAYNDVLVIHSLNITCLSLMVGITLEMVDEELLDLAIAALFSNIGYTELPQSDFKNLLRTQAYNNPAMKKHLEVFSDITSCSTFLRKKNIILGILDRYEYYNGKGFPSEKKGEEISLFGRILNIVLVYDSMVGGYNYTTGLTPEEAFQILIENKDMKFDNNIINIFLQRTTYYKLGEKVHLPDGTFGTIIGFDNYIKSPHRPIVQLENGYKFNLLTSMLV